jgi:hypothetical protein
MKRSASVVTRLAAGWYQTIFATVPDARAKGAEFAHCLNGIGGSPVHVVDMEPVNA